MHALSSYCLLAVALLAITSGLTPRARSRLLRRASTTRRYEATIDTDVLEQDALKPLVGAIDQGTSSTRFVVFTTKGRVLASAQMEHQQIFPPGKDKVGWHEHDPIEIFQNTKTCIEDVQKAFQKRNLPLDLAALGITNQRETTVAWNKETGLCYCNAVVWDDTRTTSIASRIARGNKDRLREKTGLPLTSYFAGTKVKWLLDNVPQLQQDLQDPDKRDQVCFGTIDTWLIYQLTGTESTYDGAANCKGKLVTDVTNASRWLFMDLKKQAFDQQLVDEVCSPHSLPISALPEIFPSSHIYATCQASCGIDVLDQVPLAGVLGDQHAALFGNTAFNPGEAKCTYGTGLFLMMNTGTEAIPSTHGLLTTIGYQIGQNEVQYALEGSVSHSGSTIQWLRDQLQIIKTAKESGELAQKTDSNDGLYFVPAFSGLFSPYWDSSARGCLVGMTATHRKEHICRAALEATAYQAREVLEAMEADSNVKLKTLNVDGGGTRNELLMQFQADIIDVPVVRPKVLETTALGAAFAAGIAVQVWKDMDEIKLLYEPDMQFNPQMSKSEREKNWFGWKKAIVRSMGWIENNEDFDTAVDVDKSAAVQREKEKAIMLLGRKKTAKRQLLQIALAIIGGMLLGMGLPRQVL